ncbi:MAG: type 1 glutamine amidotransferase domain-containing protein [Bacteroidota bacterium]
MPKLDGKRVAILATNGFEEVELTEPMTALKEAGAQVHVIAPESGTIRAWDQDHWSGAVNVDLTLSEAQADDYDSLVLPGGVMNPDTLRTNADAIAFIEAFFEAGKPVASICHGPWLLIEAGAAKGRRLTSYPSIKTDLINAGAEWVDEDVVVDQGLVTSRNPGDLPAFIGKVIEETREGVHEAQREQFVAA